MVKPGPDGRMKEGSGRLYLDEAQLLFNSRTWQKNKGFIEFFTQHRKLGWDVYLIAHSADMIDAQIRFLIEYEARLRNMHKVKVFGLIPVSPYPLFLSIVRYSGISAGAGSIAWRRLYTLNKAYASLYDSMQVFAFDDAQVDVTYQGYLEDVADQNGSKQEVVSPGVILREIERSRIVVNFSFWHPYYMKRFPELRRAKHSIDVARRLGFAPYSLLPPSGNSN